MSMFTPIALAALILPMSPFPPEEKVTTIGLVRADIPTLFMHGMRNDSGELLLPVRYQIRRDQPALYRFWFELRDAKEPFQSDPIFTWQSPSFTIGDSTHVNSCKVISLDCPPGKYRMTVTIQQFIDGIDRDTRKPVAIWLPRSGSSFDSVTIR
jgi:hypothetical protein